MIRGLVEAWAVGAAGVAASFLALRANMLKPENRPWYDAPPSVRWGLLGLSVALGGYVVAAFDGYDPAPGEAVICTALAVCALLMWWDLHRRPAPGEAGEPSANATAEDAARSQAVIERTGETVSQLAARSRDRGEPPAWPGA